MLKEKWQIFFHGAVKAARLMVGVPDYANYLRHMQEHHPEIPTMTEAEFHEKAISARYPGKSGKITKCPC